MKKLLWSIFVLITLLIFIGLTSCLSVGDEERPGLKINSDLVVAKIWSVSFFGDNGEDHTSKFNDVYLQFLPNLRLSVTQGCESVEGEWILSTDSTLLVIRLPDAVDPINQLQDEWVITKLTDNEMHIIEQDDRGDEEFKLITAPLRALSCDDCLDFTNILTDSVWSVTLFEKNAVNQTDELRGVHLQFFDDGTFNLVTSNQELQGDWAITANCEVLAIDLEEGVVFDEIVSDLATEWTILTFDDGFMSFEANDESENFLHLTKGQFPDCVDLATDLHNTSWYVSKFVINDDMVTEDFAGTGITFLPNNQLVTEVIIGPAVLGDWLLAGDCDELILNIQAGSLQELSRSWTIVEITDNLIKLTYEENTLMIEMHLKQGEPKLSIACTRLIGFIQEGTWSVHSYLDNGNEEADDFYDYTFTFRENGSFVATENAEEVSGSWSLLRGCQLINLDIENTGPLGELNRDWYIEYYEDYEIKLVYSKGDEYKELLLVNS